MKFYECSFVKRIIIPSLFFLLPIGACYVDAQAKDIAILAWVAALVCAVFSAIFGKRIFIDPQSKKISTDQTTLGFAFFSKAFNFKDFDYISVHRERVYSTSVPLPAHKGAFICSAVRNDFNFVIRTSSSEQKINEIALRVRDLTGLPIKYAGEVLL